MESIKGTEALKMAETAEKLSAAAKIAEKAAADAKEKIKTQNQRSQLAMKIFTAVNLIACIALAIYGYKTGIFTSVDTLREWVDGFGPAAPIVFIIFQAVQVVIPIIPGGVSLLGGVVIFGGWYGFLYNYIGICLGSFTVFEISRRLGRPLVYRMFPEKAVEKYIGWTSDKNRFTKLFALAIFLPVAPDDMLCYIAGTTEMRRRTYWLIILLCKPATIAAYSLCLSGAFKGLSMLLGM